MIAALLNFVALLASFFKSKAQGRDDAYTRGKLEAENATLEGQYADALKQGQAWADRPTDDASFADVLRSHEAGNLHKPDSP